LSYCIVWFMGKLCQARMKTDLTFLGSGPLLYLLQSYVPESLFYALKMWKVPISFPNLPHCHDDFINCYIKKCFALCSLSIVVVRSVLNQTCSWKKTTQDSLQHNTRTCEEWVNATGVANRMLSLFCHFMELGSVCTWHGP